jgi:TetR/AcrR family transcriptional regulator
VKNKVTKFAAQKSKRVVAAPRTVRKRRPIEVRSRVLEAALDVFATHGFEGTSTRTIAKVAHVSISLLMYHFQSKEGLWRAVIEKEFQRYSMGRVATAVRTEKWTAKAKLELFIEQTVRVFAEVPALHRLMTLEGHQVSERLIWLCETYLKDDFKDLCALIVEGQKDNTVRQMNPGRLRYAIIAVAAVPFSVAAEYQYLTKHNPFAPMEIASTIALIKHLVFVDP